MVIFQNLSKHGEMLKNVGENIKYIFALIFFYTLDIKNIILNPKFYQKFFAISNYKYPYTGIRIWKSTKIQDLLVLKMKYHAIYTRTVVRMNRVTYMNGVLHLNS